MYNQTTDPDIAALCEKAARLCALAGAALGVVVLLGWVLDIDALKSVLPGLVTMKGNTALGFLLLGISLLAASHRTNVPAVQSLRLAPAALVMLLGGLTLVEYGFGLNLGIDQLLFEVPAAPDSPAPPGRMAAATALAFTLTGLALLLLDGRRGRVGAQTAAMIGGLIGIMALLGYAYDVAALYGIDAYSSVALHTAAGLTVVNLGILLARPQRGLMAVITSATQGGVMARQLLPFALVAPFLIGWLRVQGERQGWFGSAMGIALVTLTYFIAFSVLIWRTAEALRYSDQRRSVAERNWHQQEARVRGIVDSALDAIVMVDAERNIVLFNPAATQMFGYPAGSVLGQPIEMLLPERFRTPHIARFEAFSKTGAIRPGQGGLMTLTGLRASGEEFPTEASISALEANGEKYYTVILRDITETRRVQEALRESEAHLKLAMEVAKIGTWERNLETGVGIWSEQTKAILGVDADRYTFEDFAPHIHPDDLPRMRAVLETALTSEPFEHEYRIVRPSGEVRWVNERGRAIANADGKLVSLLGVALDITEQRATQDELHAAKAEAERANNAKSRFLAAASHDLRQPMAALRLYATVLRNKVAADQQALVTSMDDCIANLSGLLTNLLDLSKLQAGVVKPKISDFSVFEFLSNLESVYILEAQAKGLSLRFQPSRLMGHSDPVLIKRIVGNFIVNAIRYTERGGVVVGCRRRQGKAWVEVWDSGIGIAPDKTAEIFEEFKQLGDEARNRGSGLGLAIVAKTAALLGLEVSVRSWPGRGSVFAIELPLGQQAAIPVPEPRDAIYRPLRIALVDDNPLVREALLVALEDVGHQVIAAANVDCLLARLGAQPPEVVVSDYRLAQGETGYDVITSVRQAVGTELPAIVITGDTDPKLLARMTERGIVVLHKPLDLKELQAYLEDLT